MPPLVWKPTTLHSLRQFLISSDVSLPPWSGVEETLETFFSLLREYQDNPHFWHLMKELLQEIRDKQNSEQGSRWHAIAETLQGKTIDGIIFSLKEAICQNGRSSPSTLLRFTQSLSSPALTAFLVLSVSVVGCYQQDSTDNKNEAQAINATDTGIIPMIDDSDALQSTPSTDTAIDIVSDIPSTSPSTPTDSAPPESYTAIHDHDNATETVFVDVNPGTDTEIETASESEIGCIDEDSDGSCANEWYSSHVDCDDNHPGIYPYGHEVQANGVDDDCDGVTDCSIPTDIEPCKMDENATAISNTMNNSCEHAQYASYYCDCLNNLDDDWKEGLTEIFENGDAHQVAAALDNLLVCCSDDKLKLDEPFIEDTKTALIDEELCEVFLCIYCAVPF